jgi:hypothetical protein
MTTSQPAGNVEVLLEINMRVPSTILLLVLACAVPAVALADRPHGADRHARTASEPRLLLAQNDGPSLGEAVERVRRQYNGRIVSAETRVRGNREIHYIKVLTDDGRVRTVQVPGRSRNPA